MGGQIEYNPLLVINLWEPEGEWADCILSSSNNQFVVTRWGGQIVFNPLLIINFWEREVGRADCILSSSTNHVLRTRGWEGGLHTVLF